MACSLDQRSVVVRIALVATLCLGFKVEGTMATDAPTKSWIDSWREATVALGKIEKVKLRDASGKEEEKQLFVVVGTGVIFAPPGQTSGVPWLVTAKHVFSNPAESWEPDSLQLRFAWFEQKPIDEYLGVPLKLQEAGMPIWISDNDPTVDLAAIKLTIPKNQAGRETAPAISPKDFVASADIFEGGRVAVFGYPGAVGPKYWTRALLRSGAIAWVDPSNPAEKPLLIDASIYPGNSGGPVFREPSGMTRDGNFQIGGRLAFLGIVSRGPRQPTPLTAGGQNIEVQGPKGSTTLVSESWMGIGVVEPASRVLRLLERAGMSSTP